MLICSLCSAESECKTEGGNASWSPSLLLCFEVREVSNKFMRGSSMAVLEDSTYSQMLVDWGQYIAHDISFTPQSSSRSAFSSGRDCLHTCSNAEPCFPMQVTSQLCFTVTFSCARQRWERCSFPKYRTRHVMIHINSQIQFIIELL